ncbi:MAG: MoxR family ATPase [Oscillospiraceae bacterium]|nr:MoxR family ATPase [Oscillospiraceae bacterium]
MKQVEAIVSEVRSVMVGKDEAVVKTLLAILAGGHILMEDIPGVGKTTLAVTFSKVLGLSYRRVQFTPDVLPSDITGFSVYDRNTGEFRYQPGAVLCNLFLADELNRATSRTQSALLEAMEEGQVTVDGQSRPVPQPFIVLATQNPAGAKGTQLLPDSQLDRFMIRLSLGYPTPEEEAEMIRRKQQGKTVQTAQAVVDLDGLARMRAEAAQVFVKDNLIDYIVRLVSATRNHPMIRQGGSPRASLALTAMAKAAAWVNGRDYVVPADVRMIFRDVMEHRLIWAPECTAGRASLLRDLFKQVTPPQIK